MFIGVKRYCASRVCTLVRNICAHHARLWDKTLNIAPQVPDGKNWKKSAVSPKSVAFVALMLNWMLAHDSVKPTAHEQWQRKLEVVIDGFLARFPKLAPHTGFTPLGRRILFGGKCDSTAFRSSTSPLSLRRLPRRLPTGEAASRRFNPTQWGSCVLTACKRSAEVVALGATSCASLTSGKDSASPLRFAHFHAAQRTQQAERRLRRRERSDRCSRIGFRPLLACRASDLRSLKWSVETSHFLISPFPHFLIPILSHSHITFVPRSVMTQLVIANEGL